MRVFKSIVQVFATGYIFVFFSEHLFWARVRPGDSVSEWIGTWVAYSLMAFVFLLLVSHFRVKNIWALFLAGAAFGWIGEGIVVQTAYEMLPLSISFTGLAWHALLTVWIGWYAVRESLLSPNPWSTLKLALIIGLFYGLWAISWWVEPDGGIAAIPQFAAYSVTTTGLAIPAYWLANWSSSEPFTPSRWAIALIALIVIVYFCFVTLPAAPVALIVLPILLILVYWGLRQNRLVEEDGSLLNALHGRASLGKHLGLLALPVTAVMVYSLATALGLRCYTNWILYLITTPLGFALFGISVYRSWRKKLSVAQEAPIKATIPSQ
jgi:hypothetical protein